MNEQKIKIVESRNPIIIQGATVGQLSSWRLRKDCLVPRRPSNHQATRFLFLAASRRNRIDLPELKYRNYITFSQVVRSKMKQMLLCKGIVLKF